LDIGASNWKSQSTFPKTDMKKTWWTGFQQDGSQERHRITDEQALGLREKFFPEMMIRDAKILTECDDKDIVVACREVTTDGYQLICTAAGLEVSRIMIVQD